MSPFSHSPKHRFSLVITTLACVVTLALVAPASASRCLVDVDGPNDEPGQKDVTMFCSAIGAGLPYDLHTGASLDLTGLSGGNTADLCLLFDSDTDGKINTALCTTLSGSPAKVSDIRLLACNDSSSRRCEGAVKINACSGSGKSCFADAQCGAGNLCAQRFNTVCDAKQWPIDPFPSGTNSPWDTAVLCAIDLSEFGPAGANARLINMGAMSSSSLNSSLSDGVLLPVCSSDADCGPGQVCFLAAGECYVPAPGSCTNDTDCGTGEICDVVNGDCVPGGCTSDGDCAAGKVCDVDAGTCQTPTSTGCTNDDDCATGLSCDLGSGGCVSPTGGTCNDNDECAEPLVCNPDTANCESPSDDCGSDADCPQGEVCNPATGICATSPGNGTPCSSDTDCPAGKVCKAATGTCETPTSGGSCSSNAECVVTEICNTAVGLCETPSGSCTADADCVAGQVCNVATGLCELPSGGCVSDANCPLGELCNVATATCEAPSVCYQDADCEAGQVCLAGACETPVACILDVDCVGLDSSCAWGVCNSATGFCEVLAQNEGEICGEAGTCSEGGICNGGACVAVTACDPECSLCDGGHCLSLCGNPHDASTTGVTVSDSLFILRAAVHLESCARCVCDVNGSGTITAVDTLHSLRLVARLPGVLACSTVP